MVGNVVCSQFLLLSLNHLLGGGLLQRDANLKSVLNHYIISILKYVVNVLVNNLLAQSFDMSFLCRVNFHQDYFKCDNMLTITKNTR